MGAEAKSVQRSKRSHDTQKVKRCGRSLEKHLAWMCGDDKYTFPFPKPSFHKVNNLSLLVTKTNIYVHTAYKCCKRGCGYPEYQKLCNLNDMWKECVSRGKSGKGKSSKLCLLNNRRRHANR